MPRTYYTTFGKQKDTFALPAGGNTGPYPLGSMLVLPDERWFRLNLAVATQIAGRVQDTIAPQVDHFEIVVSTIPAVGDKTIAATLAGTAIAAVDIYSEGFAHFNKLAGLDYGHRIRRAIATGQAHAAVAAAGIITVNLEPGETVDVAGQSTTEVTLTRNRFHSTVIAPTSTLAAPAGIAIGLTAAGRYGYLQTKGFCAVACTGNGVIGDISVRSTATAGCTMASVAFETDGSIIGRTLKLNITAETGLQDLMLD